MTSTRAADDSGVRALAAGVAAVTAVTAAHLGRAAVLRAACAHAALSLGVAAAAVSLRAEQHPTELPIDALRWVTLFVLPAAQATGLAALVAPLLCGRGALAGGAPDPRAASVRVLGARASAWARRWHGLGAAATAGTIAAGAAPLYVWAVRLGGPTFAEVAVAGACVAAVCAGIGVASAFTAGRRSGAAWS